MKQTTIFSLIALLAVFSGCSKHSSPVEANVTPTPVKVYIQADYAVYAWSGPCGLSGATYIESHSRSNNAYAGRSYCDGGTYTNSYTSTEQDFKAAVYADVYMAANTTDGTYTETVIPSAAPAGTVKCYKSAGGEYTVCKNAAGVITYREDHPSVHGILDADGNEVLLTYNESSTPF